ncbi:hypothetical protein M885DRAFT_469713 [Pelagophyceae sp. CCMP2097]|nr:hypothetical protein M885DRAFT_469713 [Pelagophyceae sp. CCMP2097]
MICHYAVLAVAPNVGEEELRKAYRRLVLQLHPDKAQQRGEDVAAATAKFREVQAAYDCLGDADERAFYDQNRDSILRGDDTDGRDESHDRRPRGRAAPAAPRHVYDAYAASVWPFFSRSCFDDFDDRGFDADDDYDDVAVAQPFNVWLGRLSNLLLRAASAAPQAWLRCAAERCAAAVDAVAAKFRRSVRRRRLGGFYACFDGVFADVEACEAKAANANGEQTAPPQRFGRSGACWRDVAAFYTKFEGFRSARKFREAEPEAVREALELARTKRERKACEDELSEARAAARRRYEDGIRRLAAHCKRRDPRVKARKAADAANAEVEAQRKREDADRNRRKFLEAKEIWLEDQAKEAAAAPPERWPEKAFVVDDDDDDGALLCLACAKTFASQAALSHHLGTKAHRKRAKHSSDDENDAVEEAPDPHAAAYAAPVESAAAAPVEPADATAGPGDAAAAPADAVDEGTPADLDDEGPPTCWICDKAFSAPDALESHLASRAHRAALKALKKQK